MFDNNCFLNKHGIDVGGWIAQGYVMNPQSPADHYNGPVTWMDRSNQYMLNEVWTYIGKAAVNDGEGLALGFRADFLYGASARLTTSAGLEDHINKSGENMGLAIPNLYIDAAYNDLKNEDWSLHFARRLLHGRYLPELLQHDSLHLSVG